MNLLLVSPDELDGDQVILRDRRAVHAREVIGAKVGATLKAGLVGGNLGTAMVMGDDGTAITLRVVFDTLAPPPMPVELVLAVPRPKVLSRTLEIAASFGVARIALTNSWRVDKSYLKSPRLAPASLAQAIRLGAEQGGTTHEAPVVLHERFMQMIDSPFAPDATRLVAHPAAPPIESVMKDGPCILAIGPEGGWIERELETFRERGFRPCSLGPAILRVEAAVAAALAQLTLIARLRER
jgi:RsmE family RNA methyltransferase